MIFTARQLEDLHKSNGHVALPRGARLTPLAQDWIKRHKLDLVYTDLESGNASQTAARPWLPPTTGIPTSTDSPATSKGAWLWWCDGPCGMAKAALSAHRDANLTPLLTPSDSAKTLPAVKELVAAVKTNTAAGGLFFVQSAAAATLFLNRCPSLRAVVGTKLQNVDLAIRQLAANVLVIEYPAQTLQQTKNLIGLFVKAKRDLSPETQAALQELASCG